MQNSFFVDCLDNSITFGADLVRQGFHPHSTYFLYFVDHGRDPKKSTLHEVLLLPVGPASIRSLNSLKIGIKNVPRATAKALGVLAKRKVDIKVCQATDSIAGNEGTIEAVVLLQHSSIEELDQEAIRLIEENGDDLRQYLSPLRERPAGFSDNGYYHGQFIEGTSFVDHFFSERQDITTIGATPRGSFARHEYFTDRLAPGADGIRLSPIKGSPGSSSDEAKDITIEIPPAVIALLGHRHTDWPDRKLRQVAATIDPVFNSLSLSFLDPNDIILSLTAEVTDKPGVLHAFSDWFGACGVDFRIFTLSNLEAGRYQRLVLDADYSRTDFTVFSLKALAWRVCAALQRDLPPPLHPNDRKLRALTITSRPQGYPRSLKRFESRHRFEIVDFYAIPSSNAGELMKMSETELLAPCKDLRPLDVPESIRTLDRRFSACRSSDYLEIVSALPVPLRPSGGSGALVATWPIDDSPDDDPASATLWTRHTASHVHVLFFLNEPPKQLQQRFSELPATTPHTRAQFESSCSHLLNNLSYDFPTEQDFNAAGSGDRRVFLAGSADRFGRLAKTYVKEKFEVDHFPIHGNRELGRFFKEHIRSQPKPPERLRIVDIGCAGGALTTLSVLRLSDFWPQIRAGKYTWLDLWLVDLSSEALSACRSGEFELPDGLANQLDMREVDVESYRALLSRARIVQYDISSAEVSSDPLGHHGGLPAASFDVVLSGFCHHHLNQDMRTQACRAMVELAAPGAFIGIADESMTYKQYVEYRINHLRDEVKCAPESFVSLDEHARLCTSAGMVRRDQSEGSRYYAFWGVRPSREHVQRPIARPEQSSGSAVSARAHGFDSIFLSHTWADKATARRIAADLTQQGVKVWIDEAEILVGDSLIKKISEGIDDVNYVAVLLSKSSVSSSWVTTELEIAMTQEILGRRIKVLPVLLDDVELPTFLKGKRYADIRDPARYADELGAILRRLRRTT